MNASVAIVQRRLTHYRVALFERLKERLDRERIRLALLHGVGTDDECSKGDGGIIDWAESLDTTYLFNNRLCWQPFARKAAGASLVIITQENALIANHFAVLRPPGQRLAFWGHGGNLQGNRRSLRERYKRWSTHMVDWYFAYTDMSVNLVKATGYPAERITCLNNSVDIDALASDLATVGSDDVHRFRRDLGIDTGPIGLFLGSFYREKRLDFVLDAGLLLRARIPGFKLIMVGSGPSVGLVESAAKRFDWVRLLGVKIGRDKAIVLKSSDVLLNPGLVGLGILDAFAAGIPIVTTDCGLHSPEIAYLTPSNGVITQNDLHSFVGGCERVLRDQELRTRLVEGCHQSAAIYTMSHMVDNFTDGIVRALTIPK